VTEYCDRVFDPYSTQGCMLRFRVRIVLRRQMPYDALILRLSSPTKWQKIFQNRENERPRSALGCRAIKGDDDDDDDDE
jgi:hypothetical protein